MLAWPRDSVPWGTLPKGVRLRLTFRDHVLTGTLTGREDLARRVTIGCDKPAVVHMADHALVSVEVA